ncbi:MAG TPA: amino acid ABC transporter permease [Acetobacteraceae bacterium]|nr:amino acid ABC transporter permease [Acetobacteraceae bacterium]
MRQPIRRSVGQLYQEVEAEAQDSLTDPPYPALTANASRRGGGDRARSGSQEGAPVQYTFQFGDVFQYWPLLVEGAASTIAFSVATMALSLVLGTLGAVARRSRHWPLRTLARLYVELIRNTPLLIQLFVLYFGLPSLGVRLSPNVASLVGLVVYNGAYATEILRAGLQAVHKSQIEAGLSIGMSRLQVFYYVVARPALQKVYPALSGQFVLLMLGTSVISAIGGEELTSFSEQIQSANFRSLEVYIVCMFVYLAMALLLRGALRAIGARLFAYRRLQSTAAA